MSKVVSRNVKMFRQLSIHVWIMSEFSASTCLSWINLYINVNTGGACLNGSTVNVLGMYICSY